MSLALDPEIILKSCASGADALVAAADWQPEVILMDVMMPAMDGAETLTQLRRDARTAGIPVVFMTARVLTREVEHFLSLGAAGALRRHAGRAIAGLNRLATRRRPPGAEPRVWL